MPGNYLRHDRIGNSCRAIAKRKFVRSCRNNAMRRWFGNMFHVPVFAMAVTWRWLGVWIQKIMRPGRTEYGGCTNVPLRGMTQRSGRGTMVQPPHS
jgi:hypothetical protein